MSNNVLPTVFFSQEVLERLGRDDSELKEHLHIFFKQIVIGPFKEKETGPVPVYNIFTVIIYAF